MTITYTGLIRNGQLYIDRDQHLRSEIIELVKDGPFTLTAEPLPPGPTNQMHRYYRGVVLRAVLDALNEAGNAVDNTAANRLIAHEQLKAALLPDVNELVATTGEVRTGPPSTAGLSRARFGRYIGDIVDACRELLDYEVPPPPVGWMVATDEND